MKVFLLRLLLFCVIRAIIVLYYFFLISCYVITFALNITNIFRHDTKQCTILLIEKCYSIIPLYTRHASLWKWKWNFAQEGTNVRWNDVLRSYLLPSKYLRCKFSSSYLVIRFTFVFNSMILQNLQAIWLEMEHSQRRITIFGKDTNGMEKFDLKINAWIMFEFGNDL